MSLVHFEIYICFLVIYFVVGIVAQSSQTCYSPNRTPVSDDSPCRVTESNQFSACCNRKDICLDNHLCLPQGGDSSVIYRGTCTNPSWQSDDCAQYCQDGVSRSLQSQSSPNPLTLRAPFAGLQGGRTTNVPRDCVRFLLRDRKFVGRHLRHGHTR